MTCEKCIHYDVCHRRINSIDFLPVINGEVSTLPIIFKNCNDIEKHCRHFKDKSSIVELPCNVGDTVYANCDTFNKVIGYSVEDIHIDKEQTIFFATAFDCYYNEFLDEIEFKIDEIGKTVFLTEEEAKAKTDEEV